MPRPLLFTALVLAGLLVGASATGRGEVVQPPKASLQTDLAQLLREARLALPGFVKPQLASRSAPPRPKTCAAVEATGVVPAQYESCPDGYPVDCIDNCCPSGTSCCSENVCCPSQTPHHCKGTTMCYETLQGALDAGCAWEAVEVCGVPY